MRVTRESTVCVSLARCREGVQEREGEVKGVAGQVETLQASITQLRQQIAATEEKIPRLEEAKKTAVTGTPPPPPPPSPPPLLPLLLLLSPPPHSGSET